MCSGHRNSVNDNQPEAADDDDDDDYIFFCAKWSLDHLKAELQLRSLSAGHTAMLHCTKGNYCDFRWLICVSASHLVVTVAYG